METIFGDGSQQQQGGLHGRAAGRRQAAAHRRVAVHDRVPRTRAQGKRKVAFAAPYPGKIMAAAPRGARRRADRAEGLVPVRRQGRVARHRVHQALRRRAVRRRGLHPASG